MIHWFTDEDFKTEIPLTFFVFRDTDVFMTSEESDVISPVISAKVDIENVTIRDLPKVSPVVIKFERGVSKMLYNSYFLLFQLSTYIKEYQWDTWLYRYYIVLSKIQIQLENSISILLQRCLHISHSKYTYLLCDEMACCLLFSIKILLLIVCNFFLSAFFSRKER